LWKFTLDGKIVNKSNGYILTPVSNGMINICLDCNIINQKWGFVMSQGEPLIVHFSNNVLTIGNNVVGLGFPLILWSYTSKQNNNQWFFYPIN